MFRTLAACFLATVISGVCAGEKEDLNWSELSEAYEVPSWYSEAKLGVWVHWGAQAHPKMGGGWYARHMYQQDTGDQKWGRNAYRYHCETFGHPSEAGYKEVLNDWTAPHLDTDAVVRYAKEKLGARYFVALANHHDRFDNWDSSHFAWNSVNVGPKRDIIGEFCASSKKYGLPFGVSSHDDRFLGWWMPAFGSDQTGPGKGVPYDGHMTREDGAGKWWDGLDPGDLYGLPPSKRTPQWVRGVKENWVLRHTELVEKYDVDLLWFDGHNFPYGDYGRRVCERFYNNSLKKDGKVNVVLAGKPYGLSEGDQKGWVKDYERGVPNHKQERTFQSITTVRTWFYKDAADVENGARHNGRSLVEYFTDVISKGGCFLLNLELMGDGRFPADLMPVYDEFGAWVRLNGEAIHGSKTWRVAGDNRPSDVQARKRDFSEADQSAANTGHAEQYNERDKHSPPYPHDEVRFTVRGDKLYVFVMNPKAGSIKLPALGLNSKYEPGKITAIRLIGGGATRFQQLGGYLDLQVPEDRPNHLTAVFEVGRE